MRRFLIPQNLLPKSTNQSDNIGETKWSLEPSAAAATAEEELLNEPSLKKARSETSTDATSTHDLFHCTWSHDKHINILSDDIRARINNISRESSSWLTLPGLMIKLHSPRTDPTVVVPFKGLVSFDMDGTLITPKSNGRFPKDEFDWKPIFDCVLPTLRRLHAEGYHLAIFSNQAGISSSHQDASQIQRKVDAIVAALGVPVDFLCCTESPSLFRKPCTGMFDAWASLRHPTRSMREILASTVYVGDAAGRPAATGRKKDHSDVDLKLAVNLGVAFQTPEQFFLKSSQRIHNNFSEQLAAAHSISSMSQVQLVDETVLHSESAVEIVLLIGPAASGKSSLARRFQQFNYQRINQDALGSMAKCLQTAREFLAAGRSVVIDNTNLSIGTRSTWIQLASELNIPIRGVLLQTTKELSFLLATFRMLDPRTASEDKRKIETMVIHKHFKDLQIPKVEEGFHDIQIIPFSQRIPLEASDPISFRLYHMYLK